MKTRSRLRPYLLVANMARTLEGTLRARMGARSRSRAKTSSGHTPAMPCVPIRPSQTGCVVFQAGNDSVEYHPSEQDSSEKLEADLEKMMAEAGMESDGSLSRSPSGSRAGPQLGRPGLGVATRSGRNVTTQERAVAQVFLRQGGSRALERYRQMLEARDRIKELKDLAEASEAVEDNNYGVEVAALLVGGPMTVEEATTALMEAEGGSQTTEAAAAAHSLAGRLGMLSNSRDTVFAAVEAARRCAMQQ